jgi:hypothetical protein
MWLRQGAVGGNEPWGSINCEEFLDWLISYGFCLLRLRYGDSKRQKLFHDRVLCVTAFILLTISSSYDSSNRFSFYFMPEEVFTNSV